MATYLAQEAGYDNSGVWSSGGNFLQPTNDGTRLIGLAYSGLPYSSTVNQRGTTLYTPTFILESGEIRLSAFSAVRATYRVYVVNEQQPTAFSTSNLPAADADNLVATVVSTTTMGIISLPLDNLGPIHRIYRGTPQGQRQSLWQGQLSFAISVTGTTTTVGQSAYVSGSGLTPPLVTVEQPWVTGLVGYKDAQSRISECPRCGNFMPREQFVPDGYSYKLLVCPSCRDPEDRVYLDSKPGREREGVNEDG